VFGQAEFFLSYKLGLLSPDYVFNGGCHAGALIEHATAPVCSGHCELIKK